MKHEIELKRKTYEELQQTVIELTLKNCLLEKALNKACFELMYYQERLFTLQKTITEFGRCYYIEKDIEARNANEWKEWCIKNG